MNTQPWQSVETAPRDGTKVIGWRAYGPEPDQREMFICWWDERDGGWVGEDYSFGADRPNPSMWHAMPEPPSGY